MNQMPWALRVVVTGSSVTLVPALGAETADWLDWVAWAGAATAMATINSEIFQADAFMLSLPSIRQ